MAASPRDSEARFAQRRTARRSPDAWEAVVPEELRRLRRHRTAGGRLAEVAARTAQSREDRPLRARMD
jgi:hypothetical protein